LSGLGRKVFDQGDELCLRKGRLTWKKEKGWELEKREGLDLEHGKRLAQSMCNKEERLVRGKRG